MSNLVSLSNARPIVIGAGPAGLAATWTLKEAGLAPLVLDRAQFAFSTWTSYYPSLRMNSWRRLSHLPGMKLSAEFGPWPMRDDFANYLRKYVERLDPDVRYGTEVHRVDREGGRWLVRSSIGDLATDHLVIATGLHRTTFVPDWPGLADFEGEFLHARDYTVPEPFAGKDVLVVGCGPTGIDIAVAAAAAGASRVRMSIRHNPLLFKLSPLTSLLSQSVKHAKMPPWLVNRVSLLMHRLQWGDLSAYGLNPPVEGTMAGIARSGHTYGSIDRGLVEAVRDGTVEIVRAVNAFDRKTVLLDGGTSIKPDTVIAATGQRPGLEGLLGHLGVLAEPGGRPLVHGGQTAPHAPGLYFTGFRVPSGQIPDMAVDARAIARAVTGQSRFSQGRFSQRRSSRRWR